MASQSSCLNCLGLSVVCALLCLVLGFVSNCVVNH